MTIAEFWKLIDRIDRRELNRGEGHDSAAIEPLIEALQALRREKLEAFSEQLAQRLYELDGRKFADAAGDSGSSDDGFLYARCFVVASGRETFERVRVDPTAMPSTIEQWCEPLLYAASEAWSRQHGTEWDYMPSASYETGSNSENW